MNDLEPKELELAMVFRDNDGQLKKLVTIRDPEILRSVAYLMVGALEELVEEETH